MENKIATGQEVKVNIYSIIIEFSNDKKIEISENSVCYPLEWLLSILKHNYTVVFFLDNLKLTALF